MSIELPNECVLLNRIEIIEYLNADGEIDRFEMCEGSDGSEMDMGKLLELLEWCKAVSQAPMIAHIIATQICTCDEDADDEY